VWTSPVLDGALYGEPLVDGSTVYVATENDTVYALSAGSGAVVWSTHLGTPVPADSLPCGDISPTVGITGTPVIDPIAGEIFVVADHEVDGTSVHELVGLSLTTGAVRLAQPVDPAGQDPIDLLQRTGLALDQGNVVFGFGGNYGDCGRYHGVVESVPETGGTVHTFEVDAAAGQNQGGVWLGGAAPEIDAKGDVWAADGNGNVVSAAGPYDDSDAVLELTPSMTLLQFFAPANWSELSADDLDLGSSPPALLADGDVFQAGKSGTGYLLSASHLGGIGGSLAELPGVCGGDIDGGDAVAGSTIFVPCIDGLVAVSAAGSPPRLAVQWRTPEAGGSPIVAGGLVWTIGQSGVLFGLDPTTGATSVQLTIGPTATHFPTPSVGDGLLLAASADQVHAFAGPSTGGSTSTTTNRPAPATTQPAAPAATTPSGGRPSAAVIALEVVAALVLAAVVVWLVRRRRTARPGP
jgi:outer membrane protein assembly factor BamB